MNNYKPVTIIFSKININSSLTKLHMSLYLLLNSNINKQDKLKIYLLTTDNILIEINSHLELPSDINEFNKLIKYLLEKLKIKDEMGNTLISIIKNKLNDYLPPNTYKIKMDLRGKMIDKINLEKTYTIYIGEGDEDAENLRVSDYDLNLLGVCGEILKYV